MRYQAAGANFAVRGDDQRLTGRSGQKGYGRIVESCSKPLLDTALNEPGAASGVAGVRNRR